MSLPHLPLILSVISARPRRHLAAHARLGFGGAWLSALSTTWTEADVPEAKADVLHAIYDRITVAGRRIVSVRLTPSAYAHGFALALPDKVALARPTGVGRAISTYTIPIEGRDEWIAAARRLA